MEREAYAIFPPRLPTPEMRPAGESILTHPIPGRSLLIRAGRCRGGSRGLRSAQLPAVMPQRPRRSVPFLGIRTRSQSWNRIDEPSFSRTSGARKVRGVGFVGHMMGSPRGLRSRVGGDRTRKPVPAGSGSLRMGVIYPRHTCGVALICRSPGAGTPTRLAALRVSAGQVSRVAATVCAPAEDSGDRPASRDPWRSS